MTMAFADKKKQNKYHAQWEKENAMRFSVKFLKSTDADIIAYLNTVESKQGAIKAALRYYIANGCPDEEKKEDNGTESD